MTVVIGFIGVLIILRPGVAVLNYMALAVFLSAWDTRAATSAQRCCRGRNRHD